MGERDGPAQMGAPGISSREGSMLYHDHNSSLIDAAHDFLVVEIFVYPTARPSAVRRVEVPFQEFRLRLVPNTQLQPSDLARFRALRLTT
jgi:hypothetical protein